MLMAPHHGSRLADPEGLADWARPEVVISCQGPPRWPTPTPRLYENKGARFLGTWPHGAVTVVSRRAELIVETYRTGERYVIRGRDTLSAGSLACPFRAHRILPP